MPRFCCQVCQVLLHAWLELRRAHHEIVELKLRIPVANSSAVDDRRDRIVSYLVLTEGISRCTLETSTAARGKQATTAERTGNTHGNREDSNVSDKHDEANGRTLVLQSLHTLYMRRFPSPERTNVFSPSETALMRLKYELDSLSVLRYSTFPAG